MAKKTTKELMDEFFASHEGDTIIRMRSQVDREELYEYEEKIGKQLIDMNVDELFEMIMSFKANNRKNATFMVSHSSYAQISYLYRAIFNYYIDNIEVIRNPFNDPRMKGREANKRLAQNREALTWEFVQEIIGHVHRDFDQDKADYIECIIQLFYNGFANVDEIVNLTKDDVNTKNKTVRLNGRTRPLSDRCYEVLVMVHNMEILDGWRGDFLMASWHGNYFKYPIRPKNEYDFADKTAVEVGSILNRYLSENVNKKYDTKFNYHNLFYLGFFDHIASKVGRERANELVTSYRSSEDAAELMEFANNYGVRIDNVSHLKRALQPYIDVEDIDD